MTDLAAQARAAVLDMDDDSYGLWELDWSIPDGADPAAWHAASKQVLRDLLGEGRLEVAWVEPLLGQRTLLTALEAWMLIEDDEFWTPETDAGHVRVRARSKAAGHGS